MMVEKTDTRSHTKIKNSSCIWRTVSDLFWNFHIPECTAEYNQRHGSSEWWVRLRPWLLEQRAVTPGGELPELHNFPQQIFPNIHYVFMIVASGEGRSFRPAKIDSFVASSITRLPRGRNRSPSLSGQAWNFVSGAILNYISASAALLPDTSTTH